jgi:hypothetical protein
MEESAILPLQQAELNIAGLMLMAVLLPDGQTGMVFSFLCEALGLDYRMQAHLLRSHPELRLALVLVKIQTAGGPQAVNVLVSWGIPLWLNGIRSGRRSPEQRKRLFIMRREANAALARLFFQPPATTEPAPSSMPEIVEALPPGPDPLLEQYRREVERNRQDLQQYRRELIATRRLLAATIERVLLHEGRLEYLERPRQPQPPDKHGGRPRKYKP